MRIHFLGTGCRDGSWRRATRALIAIWFLLTAAAPAAAQQGQLSGKVLDPAAAPLAGATVTLHNGPSPQAATTDEAGTFQFTALLPGSYLVTITLDGFAPALQTVTVSAGRSTSIVVRLIPGFAERTVVTATREGAVDTQAAPLAVTALSGGDLERAHAASLEDLAGLAPSLTFSQNTGFAQITIRGIGTTAIFAGADPSSAMYVDGVYLGRPAMMLGNFLDVERVEVLRGPQGTLYGRNTVGGAVNVVTRAPTNVFDSQASVSAGNFDSWQATVRLSGPLKRDRVLASAALTTGARAGFVKDLTFPEHPLGEEDVTAARGKVHVLFSPRVDLMLNVDVTHEDSVPLIYAKVLSVKPGFTVDNPRDLHRVRTSQVAEPRTGRNLHAGGSARFTARLPQSMVLSNLLAYRQLAYDTRTDTDITELDLTEVRIDERQHQWTNELTLTQQLRRGSWIAGLFLFDEVDRQPTWIAFPAQRAENRLDPRVDATSRAVFGQGTFNVSARWSLTGGIRYTREEKTFDNYAQVFSLDDASRPLAPPTYDYTDRIVHPAWTPRAAIEFKRSARSLLYASATRGFKNGGFNVTSPSAGRGFAPETAWSYELGWKQSSANGRARVSVAGFYTDYANLQVQTTISPGVVDISNAAQATIRGIEAEPVIELHRSLLAGGHVAWLDARYDRYIAVGVGGVTGDVSGRRLNNAPLWSGRTWLQWQVASPRARVLLRADARWQGTVFFTPFNDAVQKQTAYGLLDVSAEVGPRHASWSISAYIRNATNEDFITGAFSSPPPAIGGRPGDPRRFGLQFTIATPGL
jgi:iron complex outermembrane receptor protein